MNFQPWSGSLERRCDKLSHPLKVSSVYMTISNSSLWYLSVYCEEMIKPRPVGCDPMTLSKKQSHQGKLGEY